MRAPLTIAVAQPVCAVGDVGANARAHADAVRLAGARVVVFPELSLTGYDLGAATVSPGDPALRPLVDACAEVAAVALAGAPVGDGDDAGIGVLRVAAGGVDVVYRKAHLGGAEPKRFRPGDGAACIDVDGWRIGLGVCKDTGVADHVDATARLGVDVYAAGLVHLPEELSEQERRAESIARVCRSYVAFASFAGYAGPVYERTAGGSTVRARDGGLLAAAGGEPGEVVCATIG